VPVQLDKTRIAIRERSLLEILDLALQVTRHYAAPLLIAWLCGVLPLLVLNYWMIGWMAETPDDFGWNVFSYRGRYFWVMIQLVFIEAPLATVPMTLYLGDALFHQRTGPWIIASTAWRLLPRLIICLGLVRGLVLAGALVLNIEPYAEFTPNEVFLMLLVFFVFALRALRPYLGEVILLERNPLRSRGERSLTIGRRSAALHNPNSGDLLLRYLAVAVLAGLMTLSFVYGFWFVGGVLMNDWVWGPLMIHVGVPLAMWIVAGFFCVVRFLSYLDLRIRREGWEVELRMRAEAVRLSKQIG
jgi:hypothetical protein